jgi:hypothetical protein
MRGRVCHEPGEAEDVDVDVATPGLLAEVGGATGVVDDDVEPAEFLGRGAHPETDRGAVRDVDDVRDGGPPEPGPPLECRVQGRPRASADSDRAALGGELPGDGEADAASTPGHEHTLAMQLEVHVGRS